MKTKICTKCKQEKDLSEFSNDKTRWDGLQAKCNLCCKQYIIQNKKIISEKRKRYYQKTKELFKLNRKKCSDNYYQKNKEKRRFQSKENYLKNKEKRLAQNKENYLKNKDRIIKVHIKYQNKKYRIDTNYNILRKLRCRFYSALKNNSKSGSAVKLLGCTIEKFKTYFQSLFIEGMTWEKVFDGSIHIDHKKPLASFDLSIPEEQAKACHYTNLQPLWAIDNIKKSDKWEG